MKFLRHLQQYVKHYGQIRETLLKGKAQYN
jgi:hypothetical protein